MKILPKIIIISTGYFFLGEKEFLLNKKSINYKKNKQQTSSNNLWPDFKYIIFYCLEELLILPYINEKLDMFNFHPNESGNKNLLIAPDMALNNTRRSSLSYL